jgi:hypothetical protein
MAGTAPLVWATAISWPSPGLPMISSAVMARTRATAAASRNPVIAYGRVVGQTTWRTRARRPSR